MPDIIFEDPDNSISQITTATKKLDNVQSIGFVPVFLISALLAGVANIITKKPTVTGIDLLIDKDFFIKDLVTTLMANIGFAGLGDGVMNLVLNQYKKILKETLAAQEIDPDTITANELSAFHEKHGKEIALELLKGYASGTATFFLFPYLNIIFKHIAHEVLTNAAHLSSEGSELFANGVTALATVGAFEVFRRSPLPFKFWAQVAPGIFGLTLGEILAETIIANHPNMSLTGQNAIRACLPAVIGTVCTMPSTLLIVCSDKISTALKACTTSVFSFFSRRKNSEDALPINESDETSALLGTSDKEQDNSGSFSKIFNCFRFGN